MVPDFDLSWLDQPQEEVPAVQSPELPEQEPTVPAAAADQSEAPTMLIPELPQQETVDSDEAPTVFIPTVKPEPVPEVKKPAAPVEQPAPQKAKKPAARANKGGSRVGLLLGIISAALVLALVIGVLVYGIVLKKGDTIYPNVYVAGINVGGMTREKAIAAVDEAIAASYASATLKVQLPDRTISFSPEQTNVALDADEAIDEAMAYGRGGNPFSAILRFFR